MADAAVQDRYPDDVAHCYGCGRLNADGLHVRTIWRDGAGEARFRPSAHHIAIPGYVYGGLIASLVDCHGIGTAAAIALERSGGAVGVSPSPRYVTAALHVDFLAPTPLGPELELRAVPRDVSDRKIRVGVEVRAGGTLTVRGEVVAVPMPSTFLERSG